MSELLQFPAERIARHHFRPRLCTDELAQIGNPELLLSDALARLYVAAAQVAVLKSGEQGETDAIHEVLRAFRGEEWAVFAEKLAEDGA